MFISTDKRPEDPTLGGANIHANARVLRRLSIKEAINAKTTAATQLCKIPPHIKGRLIITDIIIRTTAYTAGSKSVDAVVNVGSNPANYDNLISEATINLDYNNYFVRLQPTIGSPFLTLTGYGDVYIKVTTGSNATTETWTVELWGFEC